MKEDSTFEHNRSNSPLEVYIAVPDEPVFGSYRQAFDEPDSDNSYAEEEQNEEMNYHETALCTCFYGVEPYPRL